MDTPIYDFVRAYAAKDPIRLHMPGHKGKNLLGVESLDITEIDGADVLYGEGRGIIARSEENCSRIFGTGRTLYSTGGSSQCVKAMLYLACLGKTDPLILAFRNVHSSFVSAARLLGFKIRWINSASACSYVGAAMPKEEELERLISECKPAALYVTSPDYLGNMLDIRKLSRICGEYKTPLIVDNAHGAYLKFLERSEHPVDLGADMCCDSAHKTLRALTGAAYLHIGKNMPEETAKKAGYAMSLFGSTSPSYLILQSLDLLNKYLAGEFPERLNRYVARLDAAKKKLSDLGYVFIGDEKLKWSIDANAMGYYGTDLARILEEKNIFAEYGDKNYVVLMMSCEAEDELNGLVEVLGKVKILSPIEKDIPPFRLPRVKMQPYETNFLSGEITETDKAAGRMLISDISRCPPSSPVAVPGEIIDEDTAKVMKYYGITHCEVT